MIERFFPLARTWQHAAVAAAVALLQRMLEGDVLLPPPQLTRPRLAAVVVGIQRTGGAQLLLAAPVAPPLLAAREAAVCALFDTGTTNRGAWIRLCQRG